MVKTKSCDKEGGESREVITAARVGEIGGSENQVEAIGINSAERKSGVEVKRNREDRVDV